MKRHQVIIAVLAVFFFAPVIISTFHSSSLTTPPPNTYVYLPPPTPTPEVTPTSGAEQAGIVVRHTVEQLKQGSKDFLKGFKEGAQR